MICFLVSIEKADETGLNDAVRNAKEPTEAVEIIKEWEELLKEQNKRIINIVAKQTELLQTFKESNGFLKSSA